MQAQKPGGVRNCILKVRFHFDVAGFSDAPFGRPIAYDAGGLPKVGLVGDDLDTSSFGHCDFAGIRTDINTNRGTNLLIAHLIII